MTAWENLQLGPMLGWRHLLQSRTAAFARLPLGRFAPFAASTTSARDPQSLAAHLVGFPLPPIEALSDEDLAQAQTFKTTWLTEPPTPPRSPQNLHPRSPQQSSVESEKAAAAGPNTAPALPEIPLPIAQRQLLKNTNPLGQKAAAMTAQLFRDRPTDPSNPNRQTTALNSVPPLQAKLSPLHSSPDSPLPETPDAPPTAHPSPHVPDSSASEITEANNLSLNDDAAPDTNSRAAAASSDSAIVPESPLTLASSIDVDTVQANPDELNIHGGASPDCGESIPQADLGLTPEQLSTAEITDLAARIDETLSADSVQARPDELAWHEGTSPDSVARVSSQADLETTPEQLPVAQSEPQESDWAAVDKIPVVQDASESPFTQARIGPTEVAAESLQSTPLPEAMPPLQRHALDTLESETSEPNSPQIPESGPESSPSQLPTIESTQAIVPAADAPPLPRQMLDLTERENSESPSPDLPQSTLQESPPHASATVESAPPIAPANPEHPYRASDIAGRLVPATGQPTLQRATEPTFVTELHAPDIKAEQATTSMPSEVRDRDRTASPSDASPSEQPPSSPAPPSNTIPLLPSIQAHLNSQSTAQTKRLLPNAPLAKLDAYQLQPTAQADQPSQSPAPKRRNPDKSSAPQMARQPVTTSPQQASPQQMWPLQLRAMEPDSTDAWEDPFELEPDLADMGLDDLATEVTDIDLETALEADAEPDAAAPTMEDFTDSASEDAAPAATDAVTLTAGDADTSDDEALLDHLAEWVYGELRSHLSRSQEAQYGTQSSLSPWYPQHPGFFTQTTRSDPNFPSLRLRSGQVLPRLPKLLQLTTLVRQQVESRLRQNWQRAPDRFC